MELIVVRAALGTPQEMGHRITPETRAMRMPGVRVHEGDGSTSSAPRGLRSLSEPDQTSVPFARSTNQRFRQFRISSFDLPVDCFVRNPSRTTSADVSTSPTGVAASSSSSAAASALIFLSSPRRCNVCTPIQHAMERIPMLML